MPLQFPRAKVVSFSKGLPNEVSCIAPHLLSQRAIEEFVLHQATMKGTLINLCQDLGMPFVQCHYFMKEWPKESCLLMFMLDDSPNWRGRGWNFVPLDGFLRVSWVVIHFLLSLAKYARKGVISSHHHLARSKNNWPDLPKSILNWVWVLPHESLSNANLCHPTQESRGGGCIPNIWFNFTKGKSIAVQR